MVKRLILTLVVMAAILGRTWVCEVPTGGDCNRPGRILPDAAHSGYDSGGSTGSMAFDANHHRYRSRSPGSDCERRFARHYRQNSL